MPGQKRDFRGKAKTNEPPKVRNEFTPMFEHFRDELDDHHDRRERIIKASRDITALSKKMIFSLQRVRKIQPDLPDYIEKDIESRLTDISRLLSSITLEVQGINRYRYSRQMSCIEELIEALTFAHYLRNQALMGYEDAAARVAALSSYDYLMGIFDLSGEMMRYATVVAALNGTMAGGAAAATLEGARVRTIVKDMQNLGSFFEMLPQQHNKYYQQKLETLRQSVFKVERLGYGLKVRGSERPAGWMPDTNDEAPDAEE
ncbi:hypothetical protein M406DRAFT_45836 [Cryphonectria parasitica EP155]|uniref:Translin n=1 Tax=Cryphonectria parasitica (strain ATCC 38755 / EP155) TaxID=660469 RepID=A0A9P5CLE3_CRYP1|nr:uncharacterized protein M406DRAFT_45836 [Cryphonectria parasitica EP155]KAF3762137.1 hypothetical protein M406DRAFT_45836 [Cryphonectria parasitica EP155]